MGFSEATVPEYRQPDRQVSDLGFTLMLGVLGNIIPTKESQMHNKILMWKLR